MKRALLALFCIAVLTIAGDVARSDEIVRESLYNYLIIKRDGSIVRFRRMENGATVSAIDLANPQRQVISYTGALFAPTLIKTPRRVLNIGLGAGAINRLFETAFPESELVSVEIDPMILEVAKTFTQFSEAERNKVVINDGRRFLQRNRDKWDWIILDAYVRNSQVPPHLTTLEFYEVVKDHLADDGVFATNVHGGTALFQSHVKTMTAAFPQVAFFPVGDSGSIIAMAVKFRSPNLLQAIAGADITKLPALAAFGVDFTDLKKGWQTAKDFELPRNIRVLSDDFAPAEFLDIRPAR
jgi:spermidine synthase